MDSRSNGRRPDRRALGQRSDLSAILCLPESV